jgi:hypothetical protein
VILKTCLAEEWVTLGLFFVSGEVVNGFDDRDGVENGFEHDGFLEVSC